MLSGALSLNELYQRSMATHLEHGEKWGYPTDILNRSIVGGDDWLQSIFSKCLHVLRLLLNELSKAEEARVQ